MAYRKDFGRQLRILRRGREISQEELARVARLDRSFIGRIERGEVNVTLKTMVRMARALRVKLSDLFIWVGGNPSAERARRNLMAMREALRSLLAESSEGAASGSVTVSVEEWKRLERLADEALEHLNLALGPIEPEGDEEGDEEGEEGR